MFQHFRKNRPSHIRRTADNDRTCGWIETLPARNDIRRLIGDISAEWVIIGAGYTGLAAARRLAEHYPEKEILLLDGQRAGEGSTGRNSGFAVDASPGRIGNDDAMRASARANYSINMEGLDYLRQTVRRHGIDCDWDDNGKFHCAAERKHVGNLEKFTDILGELEIPYEWMDRDDLKKRLGIDYYESGLWTKHAALVQPAALARGLAQTLPDNVRLYEESPVDTIEYGDTIRITCRKGEIRTANVFVATNGLLGEFGLFPNRLMNMTLTASLTRPLTREERTAIGDPEPWGILSAHRMGATIRYTADRRIMMRNTAEYWPKLSMTAADLEARKGLHRASIAKRWHMLPELELDYTWSGLVAVSRNFSSVFSQLDSNVYAVGCHNAGGISRGTALGKLMADHIAGHPSEALAHAQKLAIPPILPPRPFLDIGASLNVARNRLGVGREN